MPATQILVFHPDLKVPKKQRAMLEAAGFVVLVGDPTHVRVVVPEVVGATDPIARAAFAALMSAHASTAAQADFARKLCADMLKGEAGNVG